MSRACSPGSDARTRTIQPAPKGSWFTSAGLSVNAPLHSTTSPDTGANRSLTVFTASITPKGFIASSFWPTFGISTNTTSPSWSVA